MSLIDRFTVHTLCIGLAPKQLTCVVRKGGEFVTEGAYRHDIDNDDGDCRPVLSALQSYLKQSDRPAHRLPIAVVLSSQWCRMVTVPWSDAMLKDDGMTRFLQSQFIALYGDEARDWVVTTDDAPYGQPRLTCGIDRELLEGVQQLALDNKLACRGIEPIVSIAWRAIFHATGGGAKAFAVIEAGWLTLGTAASGRITAVHSQACDHAWPVELVRAWQRWMLRSPELAGIGEVAVLNVSGDAMKAELPALFKCVRLPSYELEPAFGFVTCNRSR